MATLATVCGDRSVTIYCRSVYSSPLSHHAGFTRKLRHCLFKGKCWWLNTV